ncbi:MAG: hypothetical protein IB616_02950 [Methanosarcinales archaeon]|nr:MAG: hypothetical protein IB616_02950 [Methanosarcinales archaeon]
MSVIGALKRSLGIIRDNPVILGVTFILALLGTPFIPTQEVTLESMRSLLPGILLYALFTILTMPFFMAGILGMAGEARKTGATSFSTFIREGKRNYVRLLLGYVLFLIIVAVIVGVVFGGIFIVSIILLPILLPFSPIAALAAMTVLGIAMALIPVVVLIFILFFDVGIVLSGYGVVESFKKSFAFVKSRFVSAVGYNVLRMFIFFVLTTPMFMMIFPAAQNVLLAANLLFATLSNAILYTFHAVFYAEYALGVK